MIYLDASAMVTRTLGRKYASELEEFLDSRPHTPIGTSTIGFIETVRVCDRYGTYPHLLAELKDAFTEILVTDEVRDTAAHLTGDLKTLDAIHVSSAASLEEFLTVLVSYDRKMVLAAKKLGIDAVHPGMTLD